MIYWDEIKAFFAGVWDGIVDVWNTCTKWFNDNVIQPVVNFFQGLMGKRVWILCKSME